MILQGDCIERLRELPAQSVHCCVTSPPYWGLRDYGVDGQVGLEETPEAFVSKMVEVFREVRRVLRDDGTLWLNLGDSYASSTKGTGGTAKSGLNAKKDEYGALHQESKVLGQHMEARHFKLQEIGLKQKDLVGIPWMVAFALRADGWYLRSDIVWHKPNCMPESVSDRPTKAHEYIFLLSKSEQYFYNAKAIKEPIAESSIARLQQDIENQKGSTRANAGGKTNGTMKAVIGKGNAKTFRGGGKYTQGRSFDNSAMVERESHGNEPNESGMRNKRSVWTISTASFSEAHFATFPPKLIEPCILAGSEPGDIVLDPFFGAGTTGLVALQNGRDFIGIELNPEYIEIAKRRLEYVQPVMNF